MRRFELNKLVRDGVFDDMLAAGQQPKYEILDGDRLLTALKDKLIEEAKEFDPTKPGLEELADIQEVFMAIMEVAGISSDELTEYRQLKQTTAGGFSGGRFITYLTLQDNDPWVDYYAAKPDIFLEVDIRDQSI